VSAAPGLATLHASVLTALAARNNSVQTASLQYFSVISKNCNY